MSVGLVMDIQNIAHANKNSSMSYRILSCRLGPWIMVAIGQKKKTAESPTQKASKVHNSADDLVYCLTPAL